MMRTTMSEPKSTTAMMLLMIVATMIGMTNGHGYMIQPVQRSSIWRYPNDFPYSPPNYNDNQLFCGGASTQHQSNNGKCGICGDNYADATPRANEAGGQWALGIITANYTQGQAIDVKVKITANHLGYFLFKLCAQDDVTTEVTQECLDNTVLTPVNGNGDDVSTPQGSGRYVISNLVSIMDVRLQLPSDVTCTQCVLQWTYNTGNSWGCDDTGCCVGCGAQENFINCADVAIKSSNNGPQQPSTTTTTTTTPPTTATTQSTTTTRAPTSTTRAMTSTSTMAPTTSSTTTTTQAPTTRKPTTTSTTTPAPTSTSTTTTTPSPTTTSSTTTTTRTTKPTTTTSESSGGCVAVSPYDAVPGMTAWCTINCAAGFCPATHCRC